MTSKTGSRECKKCANIGLQKFPNVGDLTSAFWYQIVTGAKSRSHEVQITQQYAWTLFQKQYGCCCALTGWPITLPKLQREKVNYTASLDRIDIKLGYLEDNVHWVYKDVNIMKNTFDLQYFLEMCSTIYQKTVQQLHLEFYTAY